MRSEERTIEGKIVSTQLATFGNTDIIYGSITIEVTRDEHVDVKIDSYTYYETLEVGNHVGVDVARLGSTDILVAKRVLLWPILESGSVEERAVATS
jgi:hypothetical protein